MISFAALKDGYEQNWANLQIRPEAASQAKKNATKLLDGKATYEQVQAKTGAPWWFVGLCHYRESSFSFTTYLGNGQPLGHVTTIVPRGRGPFTGPTAFVDGCVDALRLEGFVGATDWGIARTLFRLEGFNGFGYHNFGVNSPYLYGGSTLYGPPEAKAGKYVSDGVFNANVVDTQLGTAVVLKALMALDSTITFDGTPAVVSNEPDDDQAKTVSHVQESLNKLGVTIPPLVQDGINGPKTKAAIAQFQTQQGLTASGLPDAVTIAALAKATSTTPAPQPPPLAPPFDPAAFFRQVFNIPGPGPQPAPTPAPQPAPGAVDLSTVLQQLQTLIAAFQAPGTQTPGSTIPGLPANLSQVLQQLQSLAPLFQAKQPTDPISLIERILPLVQKTTAPATGTTTTAATPTDQLKQVADLVNAILSHTGTPALGQVNGALGDTIGNLFNGKKTAIGIGGSLLTALLSGVTSTASSGGLAGLLGTVATAVPGLSSFSLPIFLAMTAWGVLGKMEKWSQGTAPPPKAQT
jgi:lysozyme family protein